MFNLVRARDEPSMFSVAVGYQKLYHIFRITRFAHDNETLVPNHSEGSQPDDLVFPNLLPFANFRNEIFLHLLHKETISHQHRKNLFASAIQIN